MKADRREDMINFLSRKLELCRDNNELLGIAEPSSIAALSNQIIDSMRRIDYVKFIQEKYLLIDEVGSPRSGGFNPIKYASALNNSGEIDEASWLCFLISHFNKNTNNSWGTIEEIYFADEFYSYLTWDSVSNNFSDVSDWLKSHYNEMNIHFGNHRKYESKSITSNNGPISVFKSYVDLINEYGSHHNLYEYTLGISENDRFCNFRVMYNEMSKIFRFGRTAKFDHLCLLGKLKIIEAEPSEAFISESTGPKKACNLLINGELNQENSLDKIDRVLNSMATSLQLDFFAMQILEDALCNWQKNPNKYKKFSG